MNTDPCETFLAIASQFQLGDLDTEKPHPLTRNLSELASTNLPKAIHCLKQIDVEAFEHIEPKADEIAQLGKAIHDTLISGGRIFLCGCGATGRLSISLEVFCRTGLVESKYKDRFIGFMAGGDTALIKSIERFEDIPEYGKDQLLELDFSSNDLLISSSEGGETPFVIGATEAAVQHSDRRPWFLYCNPDSILIKNADRSKKIIKNNSIQKLNLSVGAMGISGSTRMQASSVLMASIGWAIKHGDDAKSIQSRIQFIRNYLDTNDFSFLTDFIEQESNEYRNERYISYQSKTCAVTVLTDTTERAPTFSLSPFENSRSKNDPAGWCYLVQAHETKSEAAWFDLLKRKPRCLEWKGISQYTGLDYLYGFHIGREGQVLREQKTNTAEHTTFSIETINNDIVWEFSGLESSLNTDDMCILEKNLVLKILMNIHSTLIMGLLKRYEGNLMTFVKPSNNKLIDRAIRYIQLLCKKRALPIPGYSEIARIVFIYKDGLKSNEAIVLKALSHISQN